MIKEIIDFCPKCIMCGKDMLLYFKGTKLYRDDDKLTNINPQYKHFNKFKEILVIDINLNKFIKVNYMLWNAYWKPQFNKRCNTCAFIHQIDQVDQTLNTINVASETKSTLPIYKLTSSNIQFTTSGKQYFCSFYYNINGELDARIRRRYTSSNEDIFLTFKNFNEIDLSRIKYKIQTMETFG